MKHEITLCSNILDVIIISNILYRIEQFGKNGCNLTPWMKKADLELGGKRVRSLDHVWSDYTFRCRFVVNFCCEYVEQ